MVELMPVPIEMHANDPLARRQAAPVDGVPAGWSLRGVDQLAQRDTDGAGSEPALLGCVPQLPRQAQCVVEDRRTATRWRSRLVQALTHHAIAQAHQAGGDLGAANIDTDGDIDHIHG